MWDDDRGGLGRKTEQISTGDEKPLLPPVDEKGSKADAKRPDEIPKGSEGGQRGASQENISSDAKGPVASTGHPEEKQGDATRSPEMPRRDETRPPEGTQQAPSRPNEVEGDGGRGSNEMLQSMFNFMNTMTKRLDAIEQKASAPIPSQPVVSTPPPAAAAPRL
jgi:hypothetical protein